MVGDEDILVIALVDDIFLKVGFGVPSDIGKRSFRGSVEPREVGTVSDLANGDCVDE